MKQNLLRSLIAVPLVILASMPIAAAQQRIEIQDRGVTIAFPDRITFSARVTSDAPLARVILEYGVEKLTCGKVIAKAFPDFTPGTSADVSWTWEMRQSGSEPPGTTIWYRWRVTDTSGAEQRSDERRATWLDDTHGWRSINREKLTLHWYDGSREFAQELLDSAVGSLDQLGRTTGVTPPSPIDMYIYASTADMRDAILYEPGWTGGQAYPDHDIVIIGISPDQLDWGKRTEAHELTHVLVGHLTFSCLGSVPTWLNEGIAVYGEGGPEPASKVQLQAAINDNRVISVRALSGGFSEHPDKADLSYAQSYSMVNFLVATFGQEKIIALFGALQQGMTIEDALQRSYGFGLDGLEDRWRASIGAQPRNARGATPTATAPPTPVPTYRPISGAPGPRGAAPPTGATPAPEAIPTRAVAGAAPPMTAPDLPTPGIFLGTAGIAVGALIAAVAVLTATFIVIRRRKNR